MIANVNEQVWIDFDLDTAVFLDTIAYWLKKNAANKQPRNFHNGRYWTYNTQEAYQKMFPGWKRETIRRIIRNAVNNGLLLVDNFNQKNYDRTCWYSLTDKALEYYPGLLEIIKYKPNTDGKPLVDSNQPLVDSNQAIPKQLPSSSNNTITTTSSSKSKKLELMWQMIAVYREIFPNNPQPHDRVIATTLQKTLQTLIKRWPELDPEGKELDIGAFRKYLTLLHDTAPKFSLNEYVTKDGNKKKNNMETFCRWNTIVQFLENKYS